MGGVGGSGAWPAGACYGPRLSNIRLSAATTDAISRRLARRAWAALARPAAVVWGASRRVFRPWQTGHLGLSSDSRVCWLST